jgi:hypothetical protein
MSKLPYLRTMFATCMLFARMVYGWIAATIFASFYNLWPTLATVVFGQ